MELSRPESNSSSEIIDVVNLNENDVIEMNESNNDSISELENQLQRAQLSGDVFGVMEINLKLGDAYSERNQFEMANMRYNETIQLQTHSQLSSWDNCNRKGIQLYNWKQYEAAGVIFFENLREADAMSDNSGKIYYRAESIEKFGACLRELNKCDDAIRYFKELLEIATNLNDSMLELNAVCQLEFCFKRIADNLQSQNSDLVKREALQNAKNYNMQRLRIAKENERRHLIPTEKLAQIYFFCGNYEESIKLHKIILEVSQIPAKRNDLKALEEQCNLGHVYFASGAIQDAYTAYQKAKGMSIDLDKRAIRVEILYNMYQIYKAENNFVSAKVELNAYLSLTSQLRDHYRQCLGYRSMCELMNLMNDFQGGVESARNHLEAAKIVGDRNEIILAERNVAQFNRYLQDIAEAGPSHANAEQQGTHESIDALTSIWQNRNDLAIEYYSARKYVLAENMFVKNLEFIENEYKNQFAKVKTLRNLGVLCQTVENFDMAYNYLYHGYQIAQSMKDIVMQQSILYELGLTLFKKNRNISQLNSEDEKARARVELQEALLRFQEYLNDVTEPEKKFEAISCMGKIYRLFDDDQNAINCFEANIKNAVSLGDAMKEMKMNLKLGQIYAKNSNTKMAIKHYGRSGCLAGHQNQYTMQMEIHFKLCTLLEKDGDFKIAITYYKQNEMLANKHQNHEERLRVNRRLCFLYMKTDEYSEALRYAHMYRNIALELQNRIEFDRAQNVLDRLQSRQQ